MIDRYLEKQYQKKQNKMADRLAEINNFFIQSLKDNTKNKIT